MKIGNRIKYTNVNETTPIDLEGTIIHIIGECTLLTKEQIEHYYDVDTDDEMYGRMLVSTSNFDRAITLMDCGGHIVFPINSDLFHNNVLTLPTATVELL